VNQKKKNFGWQEKKKKKKFFEITSQKKFLP